MSTYFSPLSEKDKTRFSVINKENLEFLMNRYNKVNRWVIADMIRRSAYHYPDKKALINQYQSQRKDKKDFVRWYME